MVEPAENIQIVLSLRKIVVAVPERDKKEGMDHLKANLVCNFTP